ncbi:MAG: DNA polymerase III subunit gamma/tau [Anaerolineales bacterium]|nr:DNA polymerase III subunit gamma/tau [Anaerolineales bacterium]
MSKVLYLKWRPLSWDQVVSQEHVITTLRNAVQRDRVSHAQLFSGPRGTGKTTTARLLAKAVNCLAEDVLERPCNECAHCQAVNHGEFLDLIEIDAASNTSVDDVRGLREKINFSPNQGAYKVYIIDEVHMLSTAAFNALLKTLEEPPAHAIFVLATTEVHKIPATVLSRCQRHEFRRIPVQDIIGQLKHLAAEENLEVEDAALGLIARQATGSMRDAISILDQLASLDEKITLDLVHRVLGTSANQAVLDLVEALLDGEAGGGLSVLQETLEKGSDPDQFGRQVVSYLRSLLLVKMGNRDQVDLPGDVWTAVERHIQQLNTGQLLKLIKIFNEAVGYKRSSWLPMLPLEIAFVEALGYIPGLHLAGPAAEEKLSPAEPNPQGAAPSRSETRSPSAGPGGEKQPEGGQVNILQIWDQICKLVRSANPTTQALLNTCRPLGIKDGTLILSFRSDINKEKMEKEDHLQVCRSVINEVLGDNLSIQCVLGSGKDHDFPEDIDPDGLVATAVRDLGGKYVSDQDEE